MEELYDALEDAQEWVEHYDRLARAYGNVTDGVVLYRKAVLWERECWQLQRIIKAIGAALNGGPDALTDWEIREAMEVSPQ